MASSSFEERLALIATYGPGGLPWRISRLGSDELDVQSADEQGITGTVWCGGAPGTGHVSFHIEPWTGRIIEGPQPDRFGNARTLVGDDAAGR